MLSTVVLFSVDPVTHRVLKGSKTSLRYSQEDKSLVELHTRVKCLFRFSVEPEAFAGSH